MKKFYKLFTIFCFSLLLCVIAQAQVFDPNLLNKYKTSSTEIQTWDEFGVVFTGDPDIYMDGVKATRMRGGVYNGTYYTFYSWDFTGSTNDGANDETHTLDLDKWHRITLPSAITYFKAMYGYQDVIINQSGKVLYSMYGNHSEVFLKNNCPPISNMTYSNGLFQWPAHDLAGLTSVSYQIFWATISNPTYFTHIATTSSPQYDPNVIGTYKVRASMDGKVSSFSNSIRITSLSKNGVEDLSQAYSYALFDNYPNPFNPSTTIGFTIPYDGFVSLKVYDVLGREVAELVNEFRNVGYYSVEFNAKNLASGIYLYTLQHNNNITTKRMLLTK